MGSAEFCVRDLPGAVEDDLLRLHHLAGRQRASGQRPRARHAHRVKGHVVLDYVMVAEFERERLGRLLIAREA